MAQERFEKAADVVIIGGGAAGLSAALTLARARRSVVVLDGGQPRNAPAPAAHGLLGLEGINPLDLLARGRSEIQSYGAQIASAQAVRAEADDPGFVVHLNDGARVRAGQLLVATGVVDDLPAIPGLRQRWGRDVVHCPYCHGWEISGQRIGLLATGPMSAMQALLFGQWTDSLWFFPQGIDYAEDDLAKLRATGITIVDEPIVTVQTSAEDRLTGVGLADGAAVALDALAVPARTRVRLDGLDGLDLETTTSPVGTALAADAAGHTSMAGVWAAGNAVNPGMQVSEAAANGARVAMTMNTELVFADADRALTHLRSQVPA